MSFDDIETPAVLISDLLGLSGYGHVVGHEDLTITGFSEEHGTLRAEHGQATGLSVGQKLRIIPNHCCVVSNMVDAVTLFDAEGWREVPVAARGRAR